METDTIETLYIGARLPEPLVARLKFRAHQEKRSMSKQLEKYLSAALDQADRAAAKGGK